MEPLERRNSLYSDQKIETKRKDSKGLAVELKERLRDDLDLATLRTLTAHIIQRFDYEYIRTHFSEEEWFIGTMRELVLTLAHVVKVANALNDYPDQCLAQSDGLIGILLAYQNTLQADGMLKDKVEGVVALYDTGMRTRETLMRIRSDAHRAVELAQSYRSNPSTVEMRAGELVDLINDIEKLFMAKSSELLVRDEQLYLNSSLDEALALGLNACYDRLPKHDFALTTKSELPKESSLVTPLVMNDTTASVDAVTMQYLQREVERLCPPAFRKIVAKVVFMNLVPDQQNTGWHKAGNYLLDEETGLATIRINLVPFQKDPAMVLGVILHEIAHAGHDSFPIFVLKIWEDIMTEESHLDVTPYAAKVRQKDSRKLKAEDFAESFRLFCLEPDNLRAVSMHRYLAMQEVCSLL